MNELYTVHSVIILDSEGARIASRFYEGPSSLKEQKAFEVKEREKKKKKKSEKKPRQKALHTKTRGAYADIVMLDKQIAVYKASGDVTIYVLGSHDNNELVLVAALESIQEALEILLRGHVSKRGMLENFDYVLLAIDETIDKGVLIETDPQTIATRCAMSDRPAAFTPLHEQTLSQIIDTARDQIIRNLKN